MIVYDLLCGQKHRFEGWFASSEEYEQQRERTMVRCPLCDDADIERQLSAPNVHTGRSVERRPERASDEAPVSAPAAEGESREAVMLHAIRQMIARTEDVGAAFPEEARKMHYEEIEKRSIRGKATPEQAESLRDEGIEFLPVPDFLSGDSH